MSPFTYLLTRKFKNSFKEFLHSPGKIITTLLVIFCIGFTFYSGTVSSPSAEVYRSKEEFYAVVFALYTFVFIMTAKNGFINGASMFSMADVNLLFTGPFKEKNVLTYGLFQQLGKSMTLGIVILYQSGTVKNIYGLNISALFFVLLGYGAVIFLSQMLAAVIYSLTCSDDAKCTKGKILFYGIIGAFAALLLLNAYRNGGLSLENIVISSRDKLMYLLPVSGFLSFAVQGAIEGEFLYVISGIIIFVILTAVYFILNSKINKDFYEDVLKATEVSFSAVTARKEGKATENAPRNVKTGKTGFTKGFGASAINQKHKIENRRAKVFLLNPTSLLMVVISVVYAFIFSKDIIALFAISVYTMALSTTAGRWAREFTYPYIYLIPEKPFKKLLYLIRGDFPSMALESLLCFLITVVLGYCNIIQWLTMSLARFSFGILFIGVNLLLQRIFGDSDKKVLVVTVYMFFTILFSAPSLAAGIFITGFFPFNIEIAFAAMTAISLAIAAALIFLCRNVLKYSEYNNR